MALVRTTSHNGSMAGEPGLMPEERVAAGNWILARLHPFNQDIGSLVPTGYERYCRIFHPVVSSDASAPVRTWTEVAHRNGRVAHSGMQFHMINRPVGTPAPSTFVQDEELSWGSLPAAESAELVDLLRQYTATPDDCRLGVWTGYLDLDLDSAPRLRQPGREFAILSEPIDAVADGSHPILGQRSPNFWWPHDRRWIVVTEIDHAWTYVGGPAALVEDLLSHRELEVMPVDLSDDPSSGGDNLNASLDA